jgi:hypothetical protein
VASWRAPPDNPSIDLLENVIAGGLEIVAGLQLNDGKGTGHVVLLIGYDRLKRQWLVKNSWGEGKPRTWSYDNKITDGAYAKAFISGWRIRPAGDRLKSPGPGTSTRQPPERLNRRAHCSP